MYISDRKKVFDDVLHGTMVLCLERNKHHRRTVNISYAQTTKELEDNISFNVEREKVIQRLNGTTVWFVSDSQETYDIINRIIKRYPLLSGHEVNCKAKNRPDCLEQGEAFAGKGCKERQPSPYMGY